MQVAVTPTDLARPMWGAIVYAILWAAAILTALISYIAVATDPLVVGTNGSGSAIFLVFGPIYVPWILGGGFGIYSVFCWFAAAQKVEFVPNNGAMIAGIVLCVVSFCWQIGVVAIYQTAWSIITAVGICTPPHTISLCASLEALLIGMWLYTIMTLATMIIFCVDQIFYFGCCCNGEGRVKKNVAVVAVVGAVPMQQQQQQGYPVQQQGGYAVQQQPQQGYVQTGQPQEGYAMQQQTGQRQI